MQILGLLGMYFDAVVVVEVTTFCYFYSDLLWPYCDCEQIMLARN